MDLTTPGSAIGLPKFALWGLVELSDKSVDKIADGSEKSSLVKEGLKFLQSRGFTQHFFAFSSEGKQADNLTALALFDLIIYVLSTIFQLNRDWSSWVDPVLS